MRNCKVLAITLIAISMLLAPMSANAATKLVMWGQTEHNAILKPFIEEYEKANNVTVEMVDIHPLGQREKLVLDGPAGKGPDVFCTPHDGLGLMVLQGLVSPVEYPQEVIDQFMPVAIDALIYDGNLWGLPHSYNSVALMYNKDIYPELPATMEELIELSKANTKDERYGLLWELSNVYFSWPFFGGKGGYVFKASDQGLDVEDVGLANTGAVAALNLLRDMRTSGMNPEGTDISVANSLFLEGKVGAVVDGAWAVNGYKEAGLNYGIAPFPPFADGSELTPFVTVGAYWVSAFSQHKEEAAKLIQFLTSFEPLLAVYEGTRDMPPRKDVIQHPVVADNPDARALAIQAGQGMPTPNVPEMNAVWGPFTDAVVATLNGQVEADVALEMAVEMIHEAIGEMHRGANR